MIDSVTITCPWAGEETPQAWLVAVPDLVECSVAAGPTPGMVTVTVPSLELAGFILLSTDDEEISILRSGVDLTCETLRAMAPVGAVALVERRSQAAWIAGAVRHYGQRGMAEPAMEAMQACLDELADGNEAETIRQWRRALRLSRGISETTMRVAEQMRPTLPIRYRHFTDMPYSLHNVPGLAFAASPDDPWHFVLEWHIAGPFPLEWSGDNVNVGTPAGFTRAYPPETEGNPSAMFNTVDGRSGWRYVESSLSGLLDLRTHFTTTNNVLCYARTTITAPRDMDVTLSLGSNDGAKVFVNGAEVFALSAGRKADPHMNEIPVHLNAGENTVLVKVMNLGGGWQLYLSANDPERVLQYSAQ